MFVAGIIDAAEVDNTPDVILISSNNPPYVYRNDQGKIVGESLEHITEILDKAGVTYRLQMAPWLRVMETARTNSNVLLYPLSRTPEREKNFHWLVPIHKIHLNLYAIKGTVKADLNDLKLSDYTAACVDRSVLCSVLRDFGIKEDNIIKLSKLNNQQMVRMMIQGRVDFVILTEHNYELVKSYAEKFGKEIVILENYSIEYSEFLASNITLDKSIVDKIKNASTRLSESNH